MKENPSESQFALYFKNRGCANLKKGKIYKILPDKEAAQNGCLRVIDESRKDCVYPESYFILLENGPPSWRKKICLSLRGCNIEFLSSKKDVKYPLIRLDTNKRTWLLWLLLRLALPLLFLFSSYIGIKYKPPPAYDTKTWISTYLHLLAVELLLLFKHLMGTEITSQLPYPTVEPLWIQISHRASQLIK